LLFVNADFRLFDILGLGSIALDDILVVDRWPAPDEKMRARSRVTRLGGLTGLALVAAAKAGAKCAYAGRLGTDADSLAVAVAFIDLGIDVSHAVRAPSHGIVRSTIVSSLEGGTRNVFSFATGLTGADESAPSSEVIALARVLFADHHGVTGSVRAAQNARNLGVPIVADFERDDHPQFRELLSVVDHLILSRVFACRITGTSGAWEAVQALRAEARAAVVVTCGAEGCWYSTGGPPEHFPALRVEARDTSGCGDVFHGVYAAALAKGEPVIERIRLATEAAGRKAESAD
jgi:sulfofructose kinase